MSKYDNSLVVKDALQRYFSEYNFNDGGYTAKWFRIVLGPVSFPLPNIKSRVDAVKIHDIHHLVTEYRADNKGEAEIGAWEFARGCSKFSVAWLLNLGSILIGIFICPRRLLRAFLRGRKCTTNFYFEKSYDDLLDKTLGELRKKIEIDFPRKAKTNDFLLFFGWCFIALAYHVGVLLIFVYALYHLYLFFA